MFPVLQHMMPAFIFTKEMLSLGRREKCVNLIEADIVETYGAGFYIY